MAEDVLHTLQIPVEIADSGGGLACSHTVKRSIKNSQAHGFFIQRHHQQQHHHLAASPRNDARACCCGKSRGEGLSVQCLLGPSAASNLSSVINTVAGHVGLLGLSSDVLWHANSVTCEPYTLNFKLNPKS